MTSFLGALVLSLSVRHFYLIETQNEKMSLGFQLQSMVLFSSSPPIHMYEVIGANHASDYFRQPDDSEDVCDWNGIQCTNGHVTSVFLSMRAVHCSVSMEWLPATVASVHFTEGVWLYRGWKPRNLPKRMRYLYMHSCSCITMQNELDLRYLPSQMEELFLLSCLSYRTVHIDYLPMTMRIVCITSRGDLIAFVSFESLPEELRIMRITHYGPEPKVRVEGTGQRKSDVRVHNQTPVVEITCISRYFQRFNNRE